MAEPDGEGWPWGIILPLAFGCILLLLFGLWYFSTDRGSDQDKLTNPQLQQVAQSEGSKACSSQATYDLVKRELFRQAAEVRGREWPELEQLSSTATLRVENPVLEAEENGALDCSATFYLDLPSGLSVAGGSSTLTATVDYILQGGAVSLRGAEPIIQPLASSDQAPEQQDVPENGNAVILDPNVAVAQSVTSQPGASSSSVGHPSFDCARATTPGEVAVCADAGLSSLDVTMATQYRRALTTASPTQLKLLQSTRDRFLAYRDECPDRQCIANAYAGRMREIRDIMDGRLTPNR